MNSLERRETMDYYEDVTEEKINRFIGMCLKKIRDAHGFSQKVMAKKLNLSRASYNQVETGNRPLTADRIPELPEIFPDLSDSQYIEAIFMFHSFLKERSPQIKTIVNALLQQDSFKERIKKMKELEENK